MDKLRSEERAIVRAYAVSGADRWLDAVRLDGSFAGRPT
jgi:hypothetical protein